MCKRAPRNPYPANVGGGASACPARAWLCPSFLRYVQIRRGNIWTVHTCSWYSRDASSRYRVHGRQRVSLTTLPWGERPITLQRDRLFYCPQPPLTVDPNIHKHNMLCCG